MIIQLIDEAVQPVRAARRHRPCSACRASCRSLACRRPCRRSPLRPDHGRATSAIAMEGVDSGKLVLHADNGGAMKGSTLLATLQRLGVVPSFSRPSVSDDNPFSEAPFRTIKYRPNYPRKPFQSFAESLQWGRRLRALVQHRAPAQRHPLRHTERSTLAQERPILSTRHDVYAAAQRRTPRRWTGSTRNWSHVGAVYLNPIKQEVRVSPIASPIR
jgi:putative transposase